MNWCLEVMQAKKYSAVTLNFLRLGASKQHNKLYLIFKPVFCYWIFSLDCKFLSIKCKPISLNPKVDSPPFAATVAAAAPLQHYQVDPVHKPLDLSIEVQ